MPNHIACFLFFRALEVPSGFFLTDTFLELDRQLKRRLFVPSGQDDRLALASKEAVKAKRCLGSLRALWRSTDGAFDDRIAEMKGLLEKSPARVGGAAADARSDRGDEEACLGVEVPLILFWAPPRHCYSMLSPSVCSVLILM